MKVMVQVLDQGKNGNIGRRLERPWLLWCRVAEREDANDWNFPFERSRTKSASIVET